jgi:hypothetical protein
MTTRLFPYCIYTTIGRDKLKGIKKGDLVESKEWKTGEDLFRKACKAKQDMAIIFSDAARDCSALIYWAVISNIKLGERKTTCKFRSLRLLPKGKHRTQRLRLKSTNKTIAPDFIRPYAICLTPDFLAS